ncbi:hypothetical protein AMAG_01493 [Allomyces macrogynus ATCC 38327]|uniref:Plasma membrane fusion protein PRM1 n=1 Tax=Allomyces macrogynus (strain ATCC 38327) TaxID=578462 RepID=A0A0L0RZ61_ALLM3|nr:hypothetical protein AMAG_01493 [Allomyces macrogynus ATCC 38327]|eukprot:KNE55603.1 hypothetical protein AMAG_01493 [Allomyces macrogynus ATCC 38327]
MDDNDVEASYLQRMAQSSRARPAPMSQHTAGSSSTSDNDHDRTNIELSSSTRPHGSSVQARTTSQLQPAAVSGRLHQLFALQLAGNGDDEENNSDGSGSSDDAVDHVPDDFWPRRATAEDTAADRSGTREDLTQVDAGGHDNDDYDGPDAVTPRVGLLSQLHRTSSTVDRAKDAEEGFLKRFAALQQQHDDSIAGSDQDEGDSPLPTILRRGQPSQSGVALSQTRVNPPPGDHAVSSSSNMAKLFNKCAVPSNDSLDAAWLGRARMRSASASTVQTMSSTTSGDASTELAALQARLGQFRSTPASPVPVPVTSTSPHTPSPMSNPYSVHVQYVPSRPPPARGEAPARPPYFIPLKDRMLRSFFVYPIFAALIALVRAMWARQMLLDAAQGSIDVVSTACTSLITVGRQLHAPPAKTAKTTNHSIRARAEAAVLALNNNMQTMIAVTRAVIIMIIRDELTLFTCTLNMALGAMSNALVGFAQDMTREWNEAVGNLDTGYQNLISGLNSQLAQILGSTDFTRIFGSSIMSQFGAQNVTQVAGLSPLVIPPATIDAVVAAIRSIPSPEQILMQLDEVLKEPFDLAIKYFITEFIDLASTMGLDPAFIPANAVTATTTTTMTSAAAVAATVTPDPGSDWSSSWLDTCVDGSAFAPTMARYTAAIDDHFRWWIYFSIFSMVMAWLASVVSELGAHWYRKLQTRELTDRRTTADSLTWRVLDPVQYAAVQAISSVVQAFRRARIAVAGRDQLSARDMRRAHALTPGGIVRLARAMSFVLYPPASVLALGALVSLAVVRVQVWYIDTYLATGTVPFQQEIFSTSGRLVAGAAEDLTSSIRRLLNEEFALIDSFSDRAATTFNQRVMHPIKSVLGSINATLAQVDATLTNVVNMVFAPVPIIQQSFEQFLYCVVMARIESFTEIYTSLEPLLSIKLPRAEDITKAATGDPVATSTMMFKNVTLAWLNTMDPTKSAERGVRATLLKIRVQLMREEEIAQWTLLFACGPAFMGLVYFFADLVWVEYISGPWKRRKQRRGGSAWPRRDEVLRAPVAIAAFLADPSAWWPALCAVTPRPRIRLAAAPRLAVARWAATCHQARKRVVDAVVPRNTMAEPAWPWRVAGIVRGVIVGVAVLPVASVVVMAESVLRGVQWLAEDEPRARAPDPPKPAPAPIVHITAPLGAVRRGCSRGLAGAG